MSSFTIGTPYSLAAGVYPTSVCILSSTKAIVVEGNNYYVVNISGSTISSVGSNQAISNTSLRSTNIKPIQRLTDDKFIIGYTSTTSPNSAFLRVGTVSGTTISWGTAREAATRGNSVSTAFIAALGVLQVDEINDTARVIAHTDRGGGTNPRRHVIFNVDLDLNTVSSAVAAVINSTTLSPSSYVIVSPTVAVGYVTGNSSLVRLTFNPTTLALTSTAGNLTGQNNYKSIALYKDSLLFNTYLFNTSPYPTRVNIIDWSGSISQSTAIDLLGSSSNLIHPVALTFNEDTFLVVGQKQSSSILEFHEGTLSGASTIGIDSENPTHTLSNYTNTYVRGEKLENKFLLALKNTYPTTDVGVLIVGDLSTSVDLEYSGSGSLDISGSATTSMEEASTDLEYSGTGNLNISGEAALQVDYEYSGSGSIEIEGDAEEVEENNYFKTGSGSLTIEGTADSELQVDYLYDSSGTFNLSGTSESALQVDYEYSGSGSIEIEGDAEEVEENNYFKTGSGSLNLSGSAELQLDIVQSGSGFIEIEGSAEIESVFHYEYIGDGSLNLSGDVEVQVGFNVYSEGIIELTGTSIQQIDYSYISSGTFNISGDAEEVEENNYFKTGSGSIQIEGESSIDLDYLVLSDLSQTISGLSESEIDLFVEAFGFIEIEGTAEIESIFDYEYVSDGSLNISGEADTEVEVEYIVESSLILNISGDAEEVEENNYFKTGSGNLNLSGSAEIEIDYSNYHGSGSIVFDGYSEIESYDVYDLVNIHTSQYSTEDIYYTRHGVCRLDSNRFVLGYQRGVWNLPVTGACRIGVIDNGAVSYGLESIFSLDATGFTNIFAIDANRFMIMHTHNHPSTVLMIANVDNNNLITYDSEYEMISSSSSHFSGSMIDSSRFILTYWSGDERTRARICTIESDDSITFGSEYVVSDNADGSNGTTKHVVLDSNKVLVVWALKSALAGSDNSGVELLTISGDAISVTDSKSFRSRDIISPQHLDIALSNDNIFLISVAQDSYLGTSYIIGEITSDVITLRLPEYANRHYWSQILHINDYDFLSIQYSHTQETSSRVLSIVNDSVVSGSGFHMYSGSTTDAILMLDDYMYLTLFISNEKGYVSLGYIQPILTHNSEATIEISGESETYGPRDWTSDFILNIEGSHEEERTYHYLYEGSGILEFDSSSIIQADHDYIGDGDLVINGSSAVEQDFLIQSDLDLIVSGTVSIQRESDFITEAVGFIRVEGQAIFARDFIGDIENGSILIEGFVSVQRDWSPYIGQGTIEISGSATSFFIEDFDKIIILSSLITREITLSSLITREITLDSKL